MSMLAERRRKTKWVINPTKKPLWAADSNGLKFGKELMEKMGWSAGKGLGANEQGIQEPLKVSYKNDTKGMGFKGNDDDWIEQQDEFNVLLSQLRTSDDSSVVKLTKEEKNEIKSLEEKSKKSKARVHYQKFTRGKDLSRYSENDLACILGTNKIKKEKPKTEEVTQSDVKNDGNLETSFGVTTVKGGSIQDYFKKKWITDKVQPNKISKTDEENKEDTYNNEKTFSVGSGEILEAETKENLKKKHKLKDGSLSADENKSLYSDENYKKKKKRKKEEVIHSSTEGELKSKQRKKNLNDIVNEELQDGLVVRDEEVKECDSFSLENKSDCHLSRKRKKDKHLKLSEGCLENKQEKDVILLSIQETGSFENCNDENDLLEVKKKKKKKKKEKSVKNDYSDIQETPINLINDSLEFLHTETNCEPVRKNKNKVKSQEIFDDINKENIADPSTEENLVKGNDIDGGVLDTKQKKKKKKYNDHNENTDEAYVQDDCLNRSDILDVIPKKKKNKKENPSDIPVEELPVESSCSDEMEQGKKKKKKKDKDRTKERENDNQEPSLEGTCKEDINGTDVGEEAVQKKKKKKRKDKKERKDSSEGGFEVDSPKKKKKKEGKLLENEENELEKNVENVDVSVNQNEISNSAGNAEIGTSGVDSVEKICQRAAYEHIPGQHTYDRVKAMIQWVNLGGFRGSNLEGVDGYGQNLKKFAKNAS